ncbi:MAG: efflux RND transporter periplasmic adaptor subunit [Planctomycetota bacterium]
MLTSRPLAAGVAVVLLVVLAALWLLSPGRAESASDLLAEVVRGPLVISVSESGTIKSREQVVLKSEVEGRTTILSLIPEGTHVEVGDLLAELDASGLEEQKTSQQITVLNAEASYIRARENLEIVKSQGKSDVARAELDYRFAEIDQTKYEEGEYRKEKQKAEANIALAEEERDRARDRRESSEDLYSKKYITATELSADKLAEKRANLNFQQANTDLELFEDYTHPRQIDQLESNVDQTKMALERTVRKADANVIQAEADFKARESEYERQQGKLQKTTDQIAKCRITAPVAGMVVYATTGRGGWRGNQEPLQEGQEIRERQELIYLPTASAMMAETKVQESSLRKVAVGMPARVTVDALPGQVLYGRVAKIGLLPDAQSVWLNPDLKVYSTEVHLEGEVEGLRPGMSCRVEIVVERHEDALSIPVQAVTRVAGKPTVYVVSPSGPEPRAIEVGLDNNRLIHVIAGLEAGEKVMLAPPLEPSSLSPDGRAESELYAGLPEAGPLPATAAGRAEGEAPASGIDFSKMENMSREEREQFIRNLTPEQRQALFARYRGGRGGGEGRGEGRGGFRRGGEGGAPGERRRGSRGGGEEGTSRQRRGGFQRDGEEEGRSGRGVSEQEPADAAAGAEDEGTAVKDDSSTEESPSAEERTDD